MKYKYVLVLISLLVSSANYSSPKEVSKKNAIIYRSLYEWIEYDFIETDKKEILGTLCLSDNFSFVFSLSETGLISIQNFSMFTHKRLKLFISKSIQKLNLIPLKQKPFIRDWLNRKYEKKQIMQPVSVFLFYNCKSVDKTGEGFMSLISKEGDLKLNSRGQHIFTMKQYYDLSPFDGIVLSPFILMSPYS